MSFDPKEASGPRVAEEGGLRRALRPAADGGRLALPDRARRTSITRLTDAVGFRYAYDEKIEQFAHGAAIEVLTPKGTIARYFYGIEFAPRDLRLGLVEASDEQLGTVVDERAAVLLPLRPDDRKVRRGHARRSCASGRGDRRRVPGVPDRHLRRELAAASAALATVNRTLTMFTNLPFFPQQASAQAAQVDAIYFFMVAVTAFFSLLIAALVVVFAIKFRRRHDDEVGVAIHGSLALELLWTVIPLVIAMVMFALGREGLLPLYRAAGRRDGDLRRRQAVDVEGAAHRRACARSTSCTCRSAAGEADHGLRGRHPQLLHPGVPREDGRRSRAATTRCGSRRRSRDAITSSAPSTAAPSTPG